MTDRDIVKVRLSGTDTGRLAGEIAELDGWTVLDRSVPRRNRRDPGERVYLTVRCGYPAVARLLGWLAANGWSKESEGPHVAFWTKGTAQVLVPNDDGDDKATLGGLKRIAKAEGRPLHELLTEVESGKG